MKNYVEVNKLLHIQVPTLHGPAVRQQSTLYHSSSTSSSLKSSVKIHLTI